MKKPNVYYTEEVNSEALIKLYDYLMKEEQVYISGKIAIKLHSG